MSCANDAEVPAPIALSADLWISADRNMLPDGYGASQVASRLGSAVGTESTVNQQPVLIENYFADGGAALEFSTWRNSKLVTNHSAVSGSHTIAAVVDMHQGSGHDYYASDVNLIAGIRDQEMAYWDGSWHKSGAVITAAAKGPSSLMWLLDATSPEMRHNGVSYTSGLTYSNQSYSALRVGSQVGQSLEINGALKHICVWDRLLDSAEIATWEAWADEQKLTHRIPVRGTHAVVSCGQSNSVLPATHQPGPGIPYVMRGSGGKSLAELSKGGLAAADGATLYDQKIDAINRFAAGTKVVLPWSQGEEDAQLLSTANAYASGILSHYDNIVADCPDMDIYMLIEELHADLEPVAHPYQSTVATGQVAAAAARSNIYTHNNDDLTLDVDDVHHTSANRGIRQSREDAAILLFIP